MSNFINLAGVPVAIEYDLSDAWSYYHHDIYIRVLKILQVCKQW